MRLAAWSDGGPSERFSDLFHDASAVSVSVCVSEELCDLFADVLCENFE